METNLNETSAVPIVVMSAAREPVEAVNACLRRAGQPAYCTWIPALPDLADGLAQINPELLIVVPTEPNEIIEVAKVRDQAAPELPIIALAEDLDDERIAVLMRNGARDAVSLSGAARFEAVMLRELRAFRLERALSNTLQSARDYRRQLETVLERSNDAIAHIQEGIIVDANDSWLELFGRLDRDRVVAHPLMDLFEAASHAALKGALTACAQGRWRDHILTADAVTGDATILPLDLMLSTGQHEGEPSVRLIVPARKRDENQLARDLADAVRRDVATGFLLRKPLLETLHERISTAVSGGVRYIAQIRIDRFATIEKDVGVTASEQVLLEFAELLRAHVGNKDVPGRFGGVGFIVLLERGNDRDVEAWAEQFVAQTGKHLFHVGAKSLSVTCTIGLGRVPHADPVLDSAIDDALEACRRGRQRGGAQILVLDRADADTRVQGYDQIWVKHIKAALQENRFRLVQQPIAALGGDDMQMYDVLVRMINHQGKEILPSEFMPAAERNGMLVAIDRWVIGAALAFAANTQPGCLFVRLARDSVLDTSLPDWIQGQIKAARTQPMRLCFQITEEIAGTYQREVLQLTKKLKQHGLRIALERFGSGRDPGGLLNALPLDFIKIDGAIVQSLSDSTELQQKVRGLTEAAQRRKIETIAERVEDANTMAVLFQLGVQYIQGNFIHEPEEVVLKAER